MKNKPPYKDSLGKRDILKNMLEQRMTLADICKALGATREDLDDYYGDLLDGYTPIEYIPSDEDRKIVWRSAAFGMTQAQIANRLGVSTTTLREYYSRELSNASLELIDDVATNLVTQAKEGSVQAGIFLMKTRAGWKETQVNEHVGKDGGPITHAVDLSELTDEELELAAKLAQKLTPARPDTPGEGTT